MACVKKSTKYSLITNYYLNFLILIMNNAIILFINALLQERLANPFHTLNNKSNIKGDIIKKYIYLYPKLGKI